MDNLITQSAVLSRSGWSRTLLAKLLGEADRRRKVAGRRHELCLYALERVERAEQSQVFIVAQATLTKRRVGGKKAVATKTAKLLAAVEAMTVRVKALDMRVLLQSAVAAYNDRNQNSETVAGKTGVGIAVDEIRRKVYAAIAAAYPGLAEECVRQCQQRLDENILRHSL